jgi:hypothetical protein
MTAILSLALALVGIMFIVLRKPIARLVYRLNRRYLKAAYSWLVDVDAPWFRRSYDVAVIAFGIICLLIAYATYFGPMTL